MIKKISLDEQDIREVRSDKCDIEQGYSHKISMMGKKKLFSEDGKVSSDLSVKGLFSKY